jgi:hypothetical protein
VGLLILRRNSVIVVPSSPPKLSLSAGGAHGTGGRTAKQLMVEMVQAALREVDLSLEQVSAFKATDSTST